MPTEAKIALHRSKGKARFDREAALEKALGVFWRHGFAPASISQLCAAMGINPPSLYGEFGNKAQLFMAAVDHYERTYWDGNRDEMAAEPDVRLAVSNFFASAARILTLQDVPCGCLVVTAAVNIPDDAADVADALKALRKQTEQAFRDRLIRGVGDGQLPADADVDALAGGLNTLLEGMSLQASSGTTTSNLLKIGGCAVRFLD
ncbi:TetR/AcrR family transcriptional regulator [Novosphingobium sp.]|jgi:AcrR family transcriptional regulator|uniref:TetR/AcrR family transcriptional regulator n=1 Tax=Novosphingobium sp. TaxID=1874826 RepID=UPI002FE3200E